MVKLVVLFSIATAVIPAYFYFMFIFLAVYYVLLKLAVFKFQIFKNDDKNWDGAMAIHSYQSCVFIAPGILVSYFFGVKCVRFFGRRI